MSLPFRESFLGNHCCLFFFCRKHKLPEQQCLLFKKKKKNTVQCRVSMTVILSELDGRCWALCYCFSCIPVLQLSRARGFLFWCVLFLSSSSVSPRNMNVFFSWQIFDEDVCLLNRFATVLNLCALIHLLTAQLPAKLSKCGLVITRVAIRYFRQQMYHLDVNFTFTCRSITLHARSRPGKAWLVMTEVPVLCRLPFSVPLRRQDVFSVQDLLVVCVLISFWFQMTLSVESDNPQHFVRLLVACFVAIDQDFSVYLEGRFFPREIWEHGLCLPQLRNKDLCLDGVRAPPKMPIKVEKCSEMPGRRFKVECRTTSISGDIFPQCEGFIGGSCLCCRTGPKEVFVHSLFPVTFQQWKTTEPVYAFCSVSFSWCMCGAWKWFTIVWVLFLTPGFST